MTDIFNTMVLPFVRSLALALVVLLVGLFIIKKITQILAKQIDKSKLDTTLKPFLLSLAGAILKILLVLSVISILGIDTTSFVAVIAAAGFAIGLAFQGSLSNFAGGILLLIFRPFKVGDFVEAGGHSGSVEAINILTTTLTTPDNKVIFIPNGTLSNSSIVNYSIKETR